MDLLYIAADGMHQKNSIPNWKTTYIPLLSMNEEKIKTAELRLIIKNLFAKNQVYENAMPAFYDLPSKKYSIPKKRMISPSTLEAIPASWMPGENFFRNFLVKSI